MGDRRPFPGRQSMFVASSADIAWYGGRAGCGKTAGLLFQPAIFLAHQVPAASIIFRRSTQEISIPGGLADAAGKMYGGTNGHSSVQSPFDEHRWTVSGGVSKVALRSLVKESQVKEFQGAELDYIGFDELPHFTQKQYLYLLTRRRAGRKPRAKQVRAFVRATMNPEPDGWIRKMVDFWIGEDGFAIDRKSGIIRWVAMIESETGEIEPVWGDSREHILNGYPKSKPMTFTFIKGRRQDNPYTDWEEYEKSLANQPEYVRRQLLEGDWNARPPQPGHVWTLPREALFKDTDADFAELLAEGHLFDLLGGWDFGRALKALSWTCGLLSSGTPPTLWIIGNLTWTATAGDKAARDRAAFLDRIDLPLNIGEVFDAADPSGWAADSAFGWCQELMNHGVPMLPIRHLLGKDRRLHYWNSSAGRWEIINLFQGWLDRRRLRILNGPTTKHLRASIREWKLDIPEGMQPIDVNRGQLNPRKDKWSHACESAGYLVALAAARSARSESAAPDSLAAALTAEKNRQVVRRFVPQL